MIPRSVAFFTLLTVCLQYVGLARIAQPMSLGSMQLGVIILAIQIDTRQECFISLPRLCLVVVVVVVVAPSGNILLLLQVESMPSEGIQGFVCCTR
jgi:hypothetical protein